MAPLQPEEGHDLCPALSWPRAPEGGPLGEPVHELRHYALHSKAARLAQVEHLRGEFDLPIQGCRIQHNLPLSIPGALLKRTRSGVLASRVDLLTAELAQRNQGADSLSSHKPPSGE